MQDRPDTRALLEAVTRFLVGDVHPHITDKALAFRVLIAANLVNVVNADLDGQGARDADERARLCALLGHDASGTEDRTAIRALNHGLAKRIADGSLGDSQELRAHLRDTLRADLGVANPRFDLSDEIE